MEPAEHLHHLAHEAGSFSAALLDDAAPVVHCPGWDVAELVRHLGRVHRWATGHVRGTSSVDERRPPPDGSTALRGWFAAGARDLLAALESTGPDQACPVLDGAPGSASFWSRRQALETAVHRWDAELAHGRPGAIDPDLAADGVAEVADVLLPRQLRLGRLPPGFAPVLLVPDGHPIDRGALLCSDPAGTAPVAIVTGAADRLFLLLWHRVGPDDPGLSVTGDRASAERTLALPLTP